MADFQVTVERHLHLALLGTLGGYHNYAVTTLRTVDGCQRSVFQHVNRGNVRRGNVVDVVNLETVHNKQRVVFLGYRGAATYADVDIGTWLTVNRRHLHTGNLTLQGYSSRCSRHNLQLGTTDGTYRTGQVLACLAGVTYHHHLFQGGVVVLQHHLHVSRRSNVLAYHADVGDGDCLTLLQLQREVSVEIGHCCILGIPLLYHGCADDGFAVRVCNRTLGSGLCFHTCRDQEQTQ